MQLSSISSIYLHSNRHVHLLWKSYFLSFYMLIGSRDWPVKVLGSPSFWFTAVLYCRIKTRSLPYLQGLAFDPHHRLSATVLVPRSLSINLQEGDSLQCTLFARYYLSRLIFPSMQMHPPPQKVTTWPQR